MPRVKMMKESWCSWSCRDVDYCYWS